MTIAVSALLRRAGNERRELGFITDSTRLALESAGLTAADIEAALIKTTRGPNING
jgi:hypothetical protein